MTNSQNNQERTVPAAGGDPGKTGDLSAAAQAVAVRAATKVAASRGGAKRAASPAAPVQASGSTLAKEGLSQKEAAAQDSPAKPTRRSARGSEVRKREKQERREARKHKGTGAAAHAGVPDAGSKRISASGSVPGGGRVVIPRRRRGAGAQQNVMKYAADNRVVRWFYALTTGPQRHVFYLAVFALIAVSVYLPVRDFYISQRTVAIVAEQKAIREKYNDSVGKEVEGLLSQEGIEDAARKEFNMVMPGEKTIDVEGLDKDGNPVTVDTSKRGENGEGDSNGSDEGGEKSSANAKGAASKDDDGRLKGEDATDKSKTGSGAKTLEKGEEPKTSAEVEAAEQAVLDNSPWYWKVLDAFFLFDGVNGMAVVSTGE